MSKVYTIYLRTNTVNGMKYVGQTKNIKQRNNEWVCLKKTYANKYLDSDRNEYGLEAFKTTILDVAETREDAWELEKKYIKELNTLYPNGYNLVKGGAGTTGMKHTDETKEKDRLAHLGKECFWKGKKRSEEARRKMSESKKGKHYSPSTEFQKGQTSQMKGKHHTEEAKNKLREKRSKKCIQLTLEGKIIREFPSTKEAGFLTGYDQGHISACCRGEYGKNKNKYKGFIWKYA